jgi:hypothetical protein
MEVAGNKVGNLVNVQQNQANNNMGQKWIAMKKADGFIELVSALNTNYCLDLYSSKTVSGNNVEIYERNNSNAQLWKFQKYESAQEKADRLAKENQSLMDDGVYFIKSIHTEYVLDQLANENKNVLANGTYTIASKMNTNYVLDMTSSSLSNGGNVQLYISNDTQAQGWIVSHDNKGYVIIKNENSGKVMEVKDNKATNLQNVQQNAANDNYGQKWIAIKNSDGSIELVSGENQNYCLDLYSSRTVNGNNVDIYERNNSNAQRWVFRNKLFNIPILCIRTISTIQLNIRTIISFTATDIQYII